MQNHRPLPSGNATMSMCYTSAGESATWLGRRPKGQAAPRKRGPCQPAQTSGARRPPVAYTHHAIKRHRQSAPARSPQTRRLFRQTRSDATRRSIAIWLSMSQGCCHLRNPSGPTTARHPRLAQPHPNPDPNTAAIRADAKPGGKWLYHRPRANRIREDPNQPGREPGHSSVEKRLSRLSQGYRVGPIAGPTRNPSKSYHATRTYGQTLAGTPLPSLAKMAPKSRAITEPSPLASSRRQSPA